jgi:formiminotetrahydrofolate cyclodeaminase
LSAAREILDLVGLLVGRTNTNVVSDLGVAAHLARAAAEAALLNVAVNLSSLPAGDVVSRYRSESGAEIEAVRTSAARSSAAIAAALGVG